MKYLGHETASGPYPIAVLFCATQKAWKRAMQNYGCPEVAYPEHEACVTQLRQPCGGVRLVVSFRLSPHRSKVEVVGFCAHEATHVWQFFKSGIREEAPGDEVEACAVQWVTQWLLECLETKGLWK